MRAVAYVDGSYMESLNGDGVYGSGVLLIVEGEDVPMEFAFGGNDETFVRMRNVAGELLACTELVAFLQKSLPQIDNLDLYYDYEGIEKWVTGEWRANKDATIAYREIMRNAQKSLRIRFYKVRAHSGNVYNERVDKLAKQGASEEAARLGITL